MTLIGFNNVVVTSHQVWLRLLRLRLYPFAPSQPQHREAWFTKEALRSIIHTTLCNLNAARTDSLNI